MSFFHTVILQKKLKRERKILRRMQDSMVTSGHMTHQSHMTQGHMTPVFPNPTQTPVSVPCERPYSNGIVDHSSRQSVSEVYHRNESLQEEDDTEVPRGGELMNGEWLFFGHI